MSHMTCPYCQSVCYLTEPPGAGQVLCSACGRKFVPEQTEPVPQAASEWARPVVEGGEQQEPLSLEGSRVAWIDRILPSKPHLFVPVICIISGAFWLLGFFLADDRAKFLHTREWYAQLLYLPAHFIALRLFVTLYVRNFLAGSAHMDVSRTETLRRMHWVLGPVGLLSLVIAIPLCARDFSELDGPKYRDSLVGPTVGEPPRVPAAGTNPAEGEFLLWPEAARPCDITLPPDEPEHAIGKADLVMWAIWCLEWIINAYIWVLLIGFLLLTMWMLRYHNFRDPVEIVLHEKHYRPFLRMSGQGASIILGFAVANALYVWYADGTITDYIGMGVTIVLLFLGFVPPWMQLKSRVEEVVNGEIFRLRNNVIQAHGRDLKLDQEGATGPAALTARINEALLMLRIDYLDRLYTQIGRNEGTTLLLKLLAPIGTILWKFLRPFLMPF